MLKFVQVLSAVNIIGVLFRSGITISFASDENIYVKVSQSSRVNARSESPDSMEGDVDISKGIFRGEASRMYGPDRDDRPSETGSTADDAGIGGRWEISYNSNKQSNQPPRAQPPRTQPPGAIEGDAIDIDSVEILSCSQSTEILVEANEDIRWELSAIDRQYLEHASIESACVHDGKFSTCNFDFRSYPSNLQTVCIGDGGHFYATEHSIQCHNPTMSESLYYQFDHYPSCYSATCEREDVTLLVKERVNSIVKAMSEYLEMPCFVDDDILRNANEASLKESSGSEIIGQWIWVLSAVSVMLINLM